MDITRPQLFLDDALVESAYRLQRRVHPPLMWPNPVLTPDRPWEYQAVTLMGTVLECPETKQLRMYYNPFAKRAGVTQRNSVCLAVSDDGIHWDRPRVGDITFEGTTDNNIILEPPPGCNFLDSPTVIYDPDDIDPQRRYKLTVGMQPRTTIHVAFSPDGIHWQWHTTDAKDYIDRRNLIPERVDGKFVMFCRHPNMFDLDTGTGGRSCYISTSTDFVHWSEPTLVLAPDLSDSPQTQFYTMTGFPYQDQYVGWVQRLWSDNDTLDIELISSRDGMNWQRLSCRDPFLPLGPEGSWYSRWIDMPSNGPLIRNGSLYWYMSGRAHCHIQEQPFPYAAIGLAVQSVDTMVSLNPDHYTGQLTTPPIDWPGGDLWLHYRKPRHSDHTGAPQIPPHELDVRVLDTENRVISGYDGFAQAYRPQGLNYLNWHWLRIRWGNDTRNLDSLAGQQIKLRVRWTNADLFGLRAGPENLYELKPSG